MLPPLTSLRCFEAVARLGSITAAAAELHVTHSAISQQIKQLEDLLGVALFLREGRGLKLSEDGGLYALQIRMGLSDLTEATRLVRARPREGEVVMAVLPSFGQYWLLPRLHRFYAKFPHYRVSLRASLDIQDLRQGLVDIGVRMGVGGWEGLIQKPLFYDDLLVVASPAFNQGRLPTTPEEIVKSPIVRSAESWSRWCQMAGVSEPQHTRLWINDSNLVLEAVRLGMGLALERRSLVQNLLDSGVLVQLTSLVVPYAYPYWLVWPDRAQSKLKQRDVAMWLEEEVSLYSASLPTVMP